MYLHARTCVHVLRGFVRCRRRHGHRSGVIYINKHQQTRSSSCVQRSASTFAFTGNTRHTTATCLRIDRMQHSTTHNTAQHISVPLAQIRHAHSIRDAISRRAVQVVCVQSLLDFAFDCCARCVYLFVCPRRRHVAHDYTPAPVVTTTTRHQHIIIIIVNSRKTVLPGRCVTSIRANCLSETA